MEYKHKTNLSNIEILGAESLFNIALNAYNGMSDLKEGFFYGQGCINSESSANGYPLEIDGYDLSHLTVLDNHVVVAVCYNEGEEEINFRVDFNGFTELN